MPLFSVIIPVYNTEKYLNKCIKSVIDQKHNKTEIILIDDCSTDGSLKVCNSFKNNPLFGKDTQRELSTVIPMSMHILRRWISFI